MGILYRVPMPIPTSLLFACFAEPADSSSPEATDDTDPVVDEQEPETDDTDPPVDDTDPPVDDTDAPKDDTGEPAKPAAPELHLLIIVHIGEDYCAFENDTDTTDSVFLTCREGLRTMAAGMADLGFAVDWQFRPGFLNLLLGDTSPERYDPTVELPALGHAFGLHQHAECHSAIDGCTSFDTWGNSAGQTTPDAETYELRADSMLYNATELGVSWTSFNIWGTAYRFSEEHPATTSLDMVLARGFDKVPTADLRRQVWGDACHDGQRDEDDDVWKSASETVFLTGTSGDRLAFFDIATTKYGDSTYDPELAHAGLVQNITCAGQRVADPAASGWNGEVFQYASLPHLHNLLELDGLGDLADLKAVAEAEAAKHGITVVYSTMPEVVVRMEAGEARGEDYAWVAP